MKYADGAGAYQNHVTTNPMCSIPCLVNFVSRFLP
jgi:hypothetical protein